MSGSETAIAQVPPDTEFIQLGQSTEMLGAEFTLVMVIVRVSVAEAGGVKLSCTVIATLQEAGAPMP